MAADFWEAELWEARERVRIAQCKLDELSQQSIQQDQVLPPQSQPTDNPNPALVPPFDSFSDQMALARTGDQQATNIHMTLAFLSGGDCYSYYLVRGQQTGHICSLCSAYNALIQLFSVHVHCCSSTMASVKALLWYRCGQL